MRKSLIVRTEVQSGFKKGSNFHVMEPHCLKAFSLFFSVGLLLLITCPVCDAAPLTLCEGEVLAPGAGHRGAPGLISSGSLGRLAGHKGRGTVGEEEADCGREGGRIVWTNPASLGLFSRGNPAVLDRHAEGR